MKPLLCKWFDIIEENDARKIWNELHKIVASHPLVKSFRLNNNSIVEDRYYNKYQDLTQELYTVLASKNRFQHYVDTCMSDPEIIAEIRNIELTNLLANEIRLRYPESYRISRRISTLLKDSSEFKRFDEFPYTKISKQVFGLARWETNKVTRPLEDLEERMKDVPCILRDNRNWGRCKDSQLIISNPELKKLIIRSFEAIDSVVTVKLLRKLVMFRLPIMDVHYDDTFESVMNTVNDIRETQEENLIKKQEGSNSIKFVDTFLNSLNKSVCKKPKQYNRMLKILWRYYMIPENVSQLELAKELGVSDSLVSDYRKKIENNLQELPFDGLSDALLFQSALATKIKHIGVV